MLELHGETLVHAAVRAAQQGGCDPVCVVTGHSHQAVENAVADLHPMLVRNENWQLGMGSSVCLGVKALQPVSALVLLACDQPAVDAKVIGALIEQHDQTGRAIVASCYSGTLGIPALFNHSCFSELQRLSGDRGAKAVIQADITRVTLFEFPAGALDIDSSDDLRMWRARVNVASSNQVHGEAPIDRRRSAHGTR
ncbi:MAG: CTP:molybdopterin cytidylyltransferase [Chthoniobacteraceae bacterium]|nr:CTP:molybdopterin cytidylyltransferase [Chthoniobacteraceae bacterium]